MDLAIISIIISSILGVITIVNFVLTRKDKAIKDTSDIDNKNNNIVSEQKLVDYRLTQVEKKLDKILDILDNYNKEIDDRVNKALENHIALYHKGD